MPRGDGTGPQGLGPRTGRGLGPCGGGMAGQNGLRAACRLAAGALRRGLRRGQGGQGRVDNPGRGNGSR